MSKVIIAIHQANFIPNFPFFYKMSAADKFILLTNCQFEKNNFQNRYLLNEKEKWVTKSVKSGLENIVDKKYTDGKSLLRVNYLWINAIKETLGINTEIVLDVPSDLKGTERLIHLIKMNGGTHYLTNPDAKDKYLDEDLMRDNGIEVEYCKVPKNLQIHIFEAFEKWGIDGTIRQLPKKRKHAESFAII